MPETFLIRTTGSMRKWRLDVEHAQCGIDLPDEGLRLALLLAGTDEALFLLESLMQEFAEVGLLLSHLPTLMGHALGMKFFKIGVERSNQSHWNMA